MLRLLLGVLALMGMASAQVASIGREVGIDRHLADARNFIQERR
jgi:hypothetical protein